MALLEPEVYHDIFTRSSLAILIMDYDGDCILDANMAAELLIGCPLEELLVKPVSEIYFPDDYQFDLASHDKVIAGNLPFYHSERRLIRNDGTILWVLITSYTVRDSSENKYVVSMLEDVSARKAAEKYLDHVSTHDGLTGLYNRAHFDTEYQRLSFIDVLPASLFVLDVDGLKKLNDAKGHKAGDELIKSVAKILKRVFTSDEIICRIGGDEFAVILHLTPAERAAELLLALEHARNEYNAGKPEYPIHFSIGSATARTRSETKRLLPIADGRMYEMKTMKKNQEKVAAAGNR